MGRWLGEGGEYGAQREGAGVAKGSRGPEGCMTYLSKQNVYRRNKNYLYSKNYSSAKSNSHHYMKRIADLSESGERDLHKRY